MRYWARDGKEVQGPFTLEELAARDFPESALVCPENRPRNRRENWLPLRKAKAPPRFHVRVGPKTRGPYTVEELGRLPGFSPDALVCPGNRNFRSRWSWAPAKSFPAFRPAQAQAPVAGGSPGKTSPVPAAFGIASARFLWDRFVRRWGSPQPTHLLAAAFAIMAAVMLWMHFSYLPQTRQTYHRVHTVMGLRVIAALQERYRQEHGRYAPDFDTLVQTAGPWLPELMSENLDLETLMVKGSSDSFKIEANALDKRRTLYRYAGSITARDASKRSPAPLTPAAAEVAVSTGTAR